MKWIAWLMKTAVKTAFICVVCTFVTVTLIQMYVTQFLQPLLPQAANTSIGMMDWLSHITAPLHKEREVLSPMASGQEGSQNTSVAEEKRAGDDDHENDHNGEEGNQEQHQGETKDADGKQEDAEGGIMEDAVAVWGSQDLSISSEEIIKLKDELSDTEKMQIFSIVASNIPMEEIQTLSTMLEDGLSAKEIEHIDELIQFYLNDADYEQVRKLIFKTDTN